jgi:hypothetical protein
VCVCCVPPLFNHFSQRFNFHISKYSLTGNHTHTHATTSAPHHRGPKRKNFPFFLKVGDVPQLIFEKLRVGEQFYESWARISSAHLASCSAIDLLQGEYLCLVFVDDVGCVSSVAARGRCVKVLRSQHESCVSNCRVLCV